MTLLMSTKAFQVVQEIYIRQTSNDKPQCPEFTYNGKSYKLWGIGVTDQDDPEYDPDGYDPDPLFSPPVDENGEHEYDEDFNPEVDEEKLHVVICAANEAETGDGEKIVLTHDDPFLVQLLSLIQQAWPKLEDISM